MIYGINGTRNYGIESIYPLASRLAEVCSFIGCTHFFGPKCPARKSLLGELLYLPSSDVPTCTRVVGAIQLNLHPPLLVFLCLNFLLLNPISDQLIDRRLVLWLATFITTCPAHLFRVKTSVN
jgi:hypothetical protein